MKKMFTIGYEGADVEQLVATLVALDVKVLADVRELPLSRKKGLSKNGLNDRLAEAGIKYIHYKTLGDPKPGRDAAKAGDFKTFERIFYGHMAKEDTQAAIADLLKVASSDLTCMMCFERCAKHCHRSIIADECVDAGFEVFNLVADKAEKYSRNDIEIPRHYSRKSLTAAE
ncbi:DUF488 domain-containing protein [Loktanella salsilacus]|uniref:DUF488 domain-containing protein n=1 Tax=Loktanella salsilacus TaxID=195913 RepID=UPI0030033E70